MAEVDIKSLDRRVQGWLLVVSLASLAAMVVAALQENVYPQWRLTRLEYAEILREKATDERGRTVAEQFEICLDQNVLPELRKIDRCVTCHAGIDDPRMADQEQVVFRAHPGSFLSDHPPAKYGCTICHQGQGRATVLPDAHGSVPYWPEPLLAGETAYTSCGRCHYENDLYGGVADLYGKGRRVEQVTQGELAAHVPGAEQIARGKRLVVKHGCLGCHKYRDRGGSLGPDITYVGDKTVHDFDFRHVEGPHSVQGWMFAHFKSPAAVVPDTLMPDLELSDDEARDLAAYMISLKRKLVPTAYTPLPRPVDQTPADGHTLYLMYCSSCHGADGVGAVARMSEVPEHPVLEAIDRPRELLTPSLRNADALAVASDDYLRWIIRRGRPGTSMPTWEGDGGLAEEEIGRLVATIRAWQADGPPTDAISARRGTPRFGRAIFQSRCAGCHGVDGWGDHPGTDGWGDTITEKWGGIGVSLRSPSFLAVASDEFLRDSIIHGRPNTAMPSWKDLSADEVSDLIAYLRSWQPQPPEVEAVVKLLAVGRNTPVAGVEPQRAPGSQQSGGSPTNASRRYPSTPATRIGQILYRGHCANCHGPDGQGAVGPSLRTHEFLSLADDRYLATAIIRGRPGTAMPAWEHLSTADVADLVGYLRTFDGSDRRELEPWLARGDWDRGRILFEGACAGCHGRYAEGGVGPQLANPTFLDTVSDAMLREWISYGKLGTPMLPFLRGQQGVVELPASQIEDIVAFLRYNQGRPRPVTARPGPGIVAQGAETYAQVCAGCHGSQGEGLLGSALSNPNFLRHASDGFLAATIALGRDNTEMQPMGRGRQGIVEMNEEDLTNVVAFLRSWENDPPIEGIPPRRVIEADPRGGSELYKNFCAGCHGADGRGEWAPELNNREFLSAASDGFLQATIARGRSGTAMRSFGKGAGGVAALSSRQINDIVSHVRSWMRP